MEPNKLSLSTQELFNSLADNLDQQVKVYRALLEVVRKERDVLVAAQIEQLNENNKTKETILVKVRSLDVARIKYAHDLAQAVGADPNQPRLLEIASKLNIQDGDRLRVFHSTLELLVKRLAEINKGNEALVKAALQNVSGAIDSIKGTLQAKPTYGKKGALVTSPQNGEHLVSKDV
jgi:flagellar biosynthesis/type III secretory pathway chaperone